MCMPRKRSEMVKNVKSVYCWNCFMQFIMLHFTETWLHSYEEMLKNLFPFRCHNPNTGNPSLTQARHREHLSQCLQALHGYLNFQHTDVVLAASSLQVALRHIGKITGKITSKEILDIVFKDFCIGKWMNRW